MYDSKIILNSIQKIANYIIANYYLKGLILTGGDTAVSICQEINAYGIQIMKEISPGIPAGLIIGGKLSGLSVVTKAGGFGEEDAILKSIEYLENDFS